MISDGLKILGIHELNYDITQPSRTEFGDMTTNVAFLIGKITGQKPSVIAENFVVSHIIPYLEDCKRRGRLSLIESANPHIAGYINFKINAANLGHICRK